MTIALVASFILTACLMTLGHLIENFAVFEAKQAYSKRPLSNFSVNPGDFLDSTIMLASKASYVGAFISAIVFLALLIAIGAGA